MKKFKVIKKMHLEAGHIELAKDQADEFEGSLVELEDVPGVYDIVEPIGLDVGEIVGLKPAASDRYIPAHTEEVKDDIQKSVNYGSDSIS